MHDGEHEEIIVFTAPNAIPGREHFVIPNARLHLVEDGHLFLIPSGDKVAPRVQNFLRAK